MGSKIAELLQGPSCDDARVDDAQWGPAPASAAPEGSSSLDGMEAEKSAKALTALTAVELGVAVWLAKHTDLASSKYRDLEQDLFIVETNLPSLLGGCQFTGG